jgi:carbon storage regulator
MLIVQRKVGERIVIGGGIEITVTAVNARGVRLGVHAPRGTHVLRGEVHDSIVAANAAAALLPATPPPAEPNQAGPVQEEVST